MNDYILEVCVDSAESALAAAKGGASRLELCQNLVIGGTTPGSKLFEVIRRQTTIPIHALIRPRFGDFCYTPYELEEIREEVAMYRELGAEGVVVGVLKDYLVDTSHMLTRELKAELNKIFVQNKEYKNLYITVLSFGFKYGIPNDADLVFDVRFLPNPYYIEELRPMSGNDQPVRDYVMNNDTAKQFLTKLTDMPKYFLE